METLFVEEPRVLLKHGLINVLKDPTTQCEKLIIRVDRKSSLDGIHRCSDQCATSL
jgi:hypothetical protein